MNSEFDAEKVKELSKKIFSSISSGNYPNFEKYLEKIQTVYEPFSCPLYTHFRFLIMRVK